MRVFTITGCCGSGNRNPLFGYEPNVRPSHCFRVVEKPTTLSQRIGLPMEKILKPV